jgi:8-oxo-dGTP pyrophosphatase MutT (NUDIX family)
VDHRSVQVTWAPATYRDYLARHATSKPPFARSLYAAVLLRTADGCCAVGQMHADTATPGRLQLPGGTVEPPRAGTALTEQDLAATARREVLEETGVDLPVERLRLWAVKVGGSHGDVGVLYTTAQPLASGHLRAVFRAHVEAATAAGRTPELTDLHLARGVDDLRHLIRRLGAVDYLPAVLRDHATA